MNKKISFLNFILGNKKKNDFLENILDQSFTVLEIGKDKEGRIITKGEGQKFPFPGFTDQETLEVVHAAKKLIPLGVDFMYSAIVKYIPKDPKEYCRFVGEIYRWFTETLIEREQPGMKEKWRKIRDVVCVFLQHDDAYRFRLQDALPELNLGECGLTEADRYFFRTKDYDFKGKEETLKKYPLEKVGENKKE